MGKHGRNWLILFTPTETDSGHLSFGGATGQ
jgi:hypothetical protein